MLGGVGLLVFLLVAVGTVLIVSGDGDTTVGVSATSTSSTEVTVPPSTTSTTSTPSVTVGIICATPEEAAQAFVDAWMANDQAAAARCAVLAAVTTIFQTSGTGAVYMFQGCLGNDPASKQCGYTYEGGAMILTVTGSTEAGWQVQSLSYIAD
jgi:hypothetical protein